jgi:hypothetical protein
MTTPAQTIDLEALATEYTHLTADEETIKERKDTIKAILLASFEVGAHPVGPYKVTIKAGARRLNAARLTAAFPVTQHPELYKPVLDTTAVKEHMAPVQLAAFQDAGAPTVTVA